MNLPRRQFLHLAAGAAALPAVSRFAMAQAYPTRPVHLVVPAPAGGVAVGTCVSSHAPRPDPYVRLSRIRLLPRVGNGTSRRMRSSACDTRAWLGVQCVLCWCTFPSVPTLRSTSSAADRSALFVGFTATMAGSDFSCPYIIGYGSSPSRCGPSLSHDTHGQARDLPASDAIPLHVMWP